MRRAASWTPTRPLVGAFLAAMDAASALIAADPEAADSFIRLSAAGMTLDDMLTMVREPDTRFSTTPARLMQYAEFMHGMGSAQMQPARWSEMLVKALAGRDGS